MIDRVVRLALRSRGIRSRYVATETARHHVYQHEGSGRLPTLVFLPGLSDGATSLVPVLLRLRGLARRMIVIEAAGHGLSEQARGDYTVDRHLSSHVAVLDQILDEPAILIGNSLGGATALRYAVERPAQVRGLYLTSPAGAHLDDADLAAVRAVWKIGNRAEARAFLDRVVHRSGALAPVMAKVIQQRAASAAVVELLRSLGPEHALMPAELGALTMPVTLLWGRSERLLPPAALAYFRAHLPAHASIVEPDGLGHCPHLDNPARLARLIADFAARA